MEYIKEGSTLPVPFNLIPTPKAFVIINNKIKEFIKKKKNPNPIEETRLPQIRSHLKLNGHGPSNSNIVFYFDIFFIRKSKVSFHNINKSIYI